MSLWQRHQWDEASRRFNPPDSELSRFKSATVAQVMPLIYGITVIELRCSGCGDVKAVRYTGVAS